MSSFLPFLMKSCVFLFFLVMMCVPSSDTYSKIKLNQINLNF